MPPQAFEPFGPNGHRRAWAAPHASFFAQLKHVERDLNDAQHLCMRHKYEAARAKLMPHLDALPDPLAGAVYLVLGQCAMHGAGFQWPVHLHKARSYFQKANDSVGLAHTRLTQATGYFARGDLQQAQTHLSAALRGFTDSRVTWGQATVQSLRAQIFLAQHDLDGALSSADAAVSVWTLLNETSEEAMARQIRAQLLASAGNMRDAARDLLWAERLVGSDASDDVRTQVTLGRADSLLWMGYTHRAAAALSRIKAHAETHPDLWVRAHYHRASGQALMVDAPVVAAQHLNTAVEALRRLGHSYALTQAQIYLACCEHRLSLPTAPRLADIRATGLGQWPVLRDALQALEPILQARPGRLTGPQPPRVFDPEAIADMPEFGSGKAPKSAHSHIDPSPQALPTDGDAEATKPWSQWMSRVQQVFAEFAQGRRVKVQDPSVHKSRSAAYPAGATEAPQASGHPEPAAHKPHASSSQMAHASPARRPTASQAEITRA